MPIPNNRTSADFTFTHEGKPDEYGVTVTSDELKSNFDSRAVDNLNDINALKDALRSTVAGEDGASAIGWQHEDASFGSTVAEALRKVISVGSYNNLVNDMVTTAKIKDGAVTSSKLADGVGTVSVEITSTNGNTPETYPLGMSYSVIDGDNYSQTGQSSNTDFPTSRGHLTTIKTTTGVITQTIQKYNGDRLNYRYFNGTSWASWEKIIDEDTLAVELSHEHVITAENGNTYETYPVGISYGMITTANMNQINQADTTQFIDYGTVVTYNMGAARCFQLLHEHNGSGLYSRYYYPDAWGPWRRLDSGNVFKNGSFTLALSHMNCFVRCYSTADMTVTIPLHNDVPFPIGTDITLVQEGVGTVTITPSTGMILVAKDNARIIDGMYAAVTLRKYDTDSWYLIGALTA